MKLNAQLSVLACQIQIPHTNSVHERDQHLETVSAKVRQSLNNQHSDLVVFPELSSIDYSRDSFEALSELAEGKYGKSYEVWSRLAKEHQTTVVYGFARKNSGRFFISVGVVAPSGELLGVYDKIHLAQFGASMEKEYFDHGCSMVTFSLNGFVIAPIICYDIRIPEMSRALAIDHDVDMILHTGAYYRDESFYSWHHFAITRAIENQIYLLSLNRAGKNFGSSIICAPWVDENCPTQVLSEHEEVFERFEVSRQSIDHARKQYSFRKDRLSHYDVGKD